MRYAYVLDEKNNQKKLNLNKTNNANVTQI